MSSIYIPNKIIFTLIFIFIFMSRLHIYLTTHTHTHTHNLIRQIGGVVIFMNRTTILLLSLGHFYGPLGHKDNTILTKISCTLISCPLRITFIFLFFCYFSEIIQRYCSCSYINMQVRSCSFFFLSLHIQVLPKELSFGKVKYN